MPQNIQQLKIFNGYKMLEYLQQIHIPVFKFYFRERGRGGERERDINMREKHRSTVFHMHPDREQTHNLGMCPNCKSNPQPFGVQDNAPTS